ncbi:50S ribosomal protein L6 [Candidatus Mycoplasma haematohominis]|uniref:50S ribosomal protein L6 n=1 Tax=Candidatus Mycoplasma haematohominis TaxID=1494318 RepID=UPI001C0A7378|nr:50S ribosomal protein L6 [Candidatus Mycoplasma haemohominis]
MSRIGNRELRVPDGIKVEISDNLIVVENTQNKKLEIKYNKFFVTPKLENGVFTTSKVNNSKHSRAQFGTINALVNNAFSGLTNPFVKKLEIVGVGYKATMAGEKLRLDLGYSHPIFLDIPSDVTLKLISSLEIELSSYNKESLGSLASQIRGFRPPEPYKGKGVKYKDEIIIKKVGKTSEGTKK